MAPEYLAPGVYVEEVASGARPIEGVPTATTAAFVGRAVQGRLNAPVPIASWHDYERCFGGLAIASPMSYAVRDFFLNGGARAAIVRVAPPDASAAVMRFPVAAASGPGLVLEAADPGAWGNGVSASVSHEGDGLAGGPGFPAIDETFFDLIVEYREHLDGEVVVRERHLDVSTREDHPRFLPRLLASESALVRVRAPMPATRPPASAGPVAADPDSGRDGGDLDDADVIGDAKARTGLYALGDDLDLLCVPPKKRGEATTAAVWAAALAVCRAARALLLVDPDPAWGASRADAVERTIAGRAALGLLDEDARNAALYFPCVRQADPLLAGAVHPFAPCGVVAGTIARVDAAHGVWKAPAGIEASLRGVDGLQVDLTDSEAERLARLGLNTLRTFPEHGTVVWGARTLRGADRWGDEYKLLPIRRLALLIENALYRGTEWVVFEPNDERSWARIRRDADAFLLTLFRRGAFQGGKPEKAYFVRCDDRTTTPADVDTGRLNIEVGFAPLRPAEFVMVRIHHQGLDTSPRPPAADAYRAFRVRVFWEGSEVPVAGFDTVDGLERSAVERDPPVLHGPAARHFEPITLERGVTHDAGFTAWASQAWRIDPTPPADALRQRSLAIALFDETGSRGRRYLVRCGRASELRGHLDANGNAIAILRLTIAHEGWTRDPT